MGRKGFSMVEMLIVIAIAAILLALGTLSFQSMQTNSATEKQVRTMYADLMAAKSQAMFQKTTRFIRVTASGYSIYATADITAAPLTTTAFRFPVTFGPSNDANLLFYDEKGIANLQAADLLATPEVICIEPNDPKLLTSIIISPTRIQMGKRNQGGACVEAQIRIQ